MFFLTARRFEPVQLIPLDFLDFEAVQLTVSSPAEQLVHGIPLMGVVFLAEEPLKTVGSLRLAAQKGFININSAALVTLSKDIIGLDIFKTMVYVKLYFCFSIVYLC